MTSLDRKCRLLELARLLAGLGLLIAVAAPTMMPCPPKGRCWPRSRLPDRNSAFT